MIDYAREIKFSENANRQLQHRQYYMNDVQLVVLGLIVLGASLAFFYLTDLVPAKIENTEMSIIISLGIGLLILIVDKRQSRHIDELIKTQHELTNEIHKMIKEQLTMIKDTHKDNEST
jgi:septal ring-binding cell division protein DamX